MPICPECRDGIVAFASPACDRCGWTGGVEGGIADFVADQDRENHIFAAYTELYDRIAEDDLASPIQGDELLALEAQRLLQAVGPVSGETVCDVGIGRGALFERLRAERPRLLIGVDLASSYLQRAAINPAGVELIRANAENLPFRAELDAVVASDVLEHVLNPADFLGSAAEALVPGGRLVIKVPFRENLSQYRRTGGCPYPMVHLRTFDRTLLRQALEDAQLRVEAFSYSGFFLGRWQPPIGRWQRGADALRRLLKRVYGPDPGPNRIHPRVGRLLMRPVVITAVARKLGIDER